MKYSFFTLFFAFIFNIACCYSQAKTKDFPIDINTDKITYYYHTGSGMATYKTIEIYPDSLVWEYIEARNDCSLKDVRTYDKVEFDNLINELSHIQFSAMDNSLIIYGNSGFSYSFEINSNKYFYFQDDYKFTGNYRKVFSIINHFINTHKTECEILFEKYSRMPHIRGEFGEFQTLPDELQKYSTQ